MKNFLNVYLPVLPPWPIKQFHGGTVITKAPMGII